jgi:glucuronoarabinoxylan endo-1,4-beta-xylanase
LSKLKFAQLLLIFFVGAPALLAQNATVQWSTTYQTMDGFGAACDDIGACEDMTTAQYASVFSPSSGIGLSIFRDAVPFDGSCSTTCAWRSPNTLAAAMGYGVTIMSTPWTPPASMKTNGSVICNYNSGGPSNLSTSSYAAFATYLANYATQVKSYGGYYPKYISVQNEPDYCSSDQTYGWGALYSAAQMDSFIANNLGPTLGALGIQVMMPEVSYSTNISGTGESTQIGLANEANTCMTDTNCSKYVGVLATHGYGGGYTTYSNLGSAHYWETENYIPPGTGTAFDGSMASGIELARDIHDWIQVGGSAYLYWRIANCQSCNDNQALIQSPEQGGTIAARFYVMGQWSKYVRPGWVRMGATENPASGVFVTAFKNSSSGNFAIVVINQNSSSAGMTFALSSFPSVGSVTPTVTSSNANLADQANVTVSSGSFSYTLPAASVVTFHGTASSTASTNPSAPTNLSATVH